MKIVIKCESDDPLKAIVYFSPRDYDNDNKCWLCGSLVTLHEKIAGMVQTSPSKITLRSLTFSLKQFGNVTVGLGRRQDNKVEKDISRSLKTLLQCINLKYSSLNLMLEYWTTLNTQDNLLEILHEAELPISLQLPYELQMKCILLVENFAKHGSFYGLSLFYRKRSIYSQFQEDIYCKFLALQKFMDERIIKHDTEISSLTNFKVFIEEKMLKKLKHSNDTKTKRQPNLKKKVELVSEKKPAKNNLQASEYNFLIEAKLVCLQVNETMLLILLDKYPSRIEEIQKWETRLLYLNKLLLSSQEYDYT
ncbi:unnamed protein product [Clavelina lepadiformis]|uniref:Uncharacterized protein n=1 Tax=Clavelina lepadiformis TaxID=159417 RepID=A0ABP0GDY8_CLALP